MITPLPTQVLCVALEFGSLKKDIEKGMFSL